MHGETNTITEKVTITINTGIIQVEVVMDITLADYKIAFKKGKPAKNIAKTIKATIKIEYK